MINYTEIEEDMSLMYRYLELDIVEPNEFNDNGLTPNDLVEMFSKSLMKLEELMEKEKENVTEK